MFLDSAKKFIKSHAETYLFGKRKGRRRSILLRGSPGIGKSDLVRQVAVELTNEAIAKGNLKEGEKVKILEVRLSQYNAIDIKGVPAIIKGKTTFFPIDKFPTVDDDASESEKMGKPILIVLEEFDKTTRDVQNAALEIVHDHAIDGRMLPEHTCIIATSNKVSDNANSNPLNSAMRGGRFVIIDVDYDKDVFLTYAKDHIHNLVYNFLKPEDHHRLIYSPDFDDLTLLSESYPCPRSWETLSCVIFDTLQDNILATKNEVNMRDMRSLISGCVGTNAGERFTSYIITIGNIDINKSLKDGVICTFDKSGADNSDIMLQIAFATKLKLEYEKKAMKEQQVRNALSIVSNDLFSSEPRMDVVTTMVGYSKTCDIFIRVSDDFDKIIPLAKKLSETKIIQRNANTNSNTTTIDSGI